MILSSNICSRKTNLPTRDYIITTQYVVSASLRCFILENVQFVELEPLRLTIVSKKDQTIKKIISRWSTPNCDVGEFTRDIVNSRTQFVIWFPRMTRPSQNTELGLITDQGRLLISGNEVLRNLVSAELAKKKSNFQRSLANHFLFLIRQHDFVSALKHSTWSCSKDCTKYHELLSLYGTHYPHRNI